jgi:glycosyltransferase involved in cell wall biosynthesis
LAPSFSEGFNLPVAEAMAMGTPVIASDIAVHRELAAGARLIDPVDGPGWLAAIEAAAATRPTVPRANPLSWPDHFAIVKEALGW